MHCRLMYVVGQLRVGGLERQLCYLLESMDRKHHQPAVTVWSFRDKDFYVSRLRELDVPIHAPPGGTSGVRKLHWFRCLARKLRPDLIHSYSFYTNFPAWYAAAGTAAVAVGSVRSDFGRAIVEANPVLGRLCARWPRTQIFNSVNAAESARKSRGPFGPEQTFVIRNGVDLRRFANTPLPNTGPIRIIAIGSLTKVKRWDRLLTVAARLRQEGFNFVLQIVGEGPLRAALQQQAIDLGLNGHVELTPRSENIPALIAGARLLVHTSDSEGCPNVVMEAMACGRPVVATDAGDTPYLVEHGKTGFVVHRGDEGALLKSIVTLIGDRDLCLRMGEAGRLRAEREFGLERLVNETFNVYRGLGWSATKTPSRNRADQC